MVLVAAEIDAIPSASEKILKGWWFFVGGFILKNQKFQKQLPII